MPVKSNDDSYRQFVKALKADQIDCFYIFHGEERYLLDRCVTDLRRRLCLDGLDSFNYKRYEGKSISIDELEEAIDTLPSFSDRTLIEIHDFDIFKSDDLPRLNRVLSDLPEYVCLLLIYDIVQFKPDRRKKDTAEILKHAHVVEFTVQELGRLVKWIVMHYEDAGKKISGRDAEYLAFITGGFMSSLHSEIEKTAAFSKGDTVTRTDIDAVVTPVLDAVAYKLTDALARHDHVEAMKIMDELFQMKEAPHKLLSTISIKMRQLLVARVCIESNSGKSALVDICGIRHDFQARALMDTARKASLSGCRNAVLMCADTALELNSSSEPEMRLAELVTKLAYI